MRRTIVMLLLGALILTGLTSGTLAVYTTSVDLAMNTVAAKRFYIGVGNQDDFDIKLAPGEKQAYGFTVTNVDGNGFATEVNMDLTVGGNFSELVSALPGMVITLTENGRVLASTADGQLSYTESNAFQADSAQTRTFMLVFDWQPGDDVLQTLAQGRRVDGVTLYITGTQHTGG